MANAYTVQVGDNVSYLNPIVASDQSTIRWRVAKVVGVVSQTSVNLAIRLSNGTFANLNGGAPVAKWTRNNVTNVWRPY